MPKLSNFLPPPTPDTDNTQVHINFDNEAIEQLRTLAKKHGVKNAVLIRGLVAREYEATCK